MKTTLLDYLRCSLCQQSLRVIETPTVSNVITQGVLRCTGCDHEFAIENGIPNMLASQLPGYVEKMREANGWVALSKAKGWYEATPEIDLALPDVVGQLGWNPKMASTWLGTYHSFTHMLEAYVRPGMKVLEVGAAKTWAGAKVVQRGCTYTGFDMVADPNIGLGRSAFYQQHYHISYEVVAGDAEFLPFASDTFDLVFAVAALHHALNLPQMVRELARVTKPNGIVAGLNEGVRGRWTTAEVKSQAEEKSYGINEHCYTLVEYYAAFHQADLQIKQVMQSTRYREFLTPRWQWLLRTIDAIPYYGDRWAIGLLVDFLHGYEGLTIYGQKYGQK